MAPAAGLEPASRRLTGGRSASRAKPEWHWCTGEISKLRPPGLQPGALPTELPARQRKRQHGGWRRRHVTGARTRIMALAQPAARHPHQVIRIVKEQRSSENECRGKKKPRLHEPTGAFVPWSEGSMRTAFRHVVRKAISINLQRRPTRRIRMGERSRDRAPAGGHDRKTHECASRFEAILSLASARSRCTNCYDTFS